METLSNPQEALSWQREVVEGVLGIVQSRGSYVGQDGFRKMTVRCRDPETKGDITVSLMEERGHAHGGDRQWVMNVLGHIFLDTTREGNIVVTDKVEAYMADLTDDTTTEVQFGAQDLEVLLSKLNDWELDHPVELAA